MNSHKTSIKSQDFDWNLLICGPIVQGDLMVNRNGKVTSITSDFNCCQTIIQNVQKWGHLFNKIILVTWTDQEKFITADLKSLGIEFLLLEDPGRESSFCRDSRVRVMTTTAGGIKFINNFNQHVLRIRTDQEFNLNAMIQSHQKASLIIRKNQRRLNVTLPHISGLCFWLDRPYSLCNFAHAGLCSDLLFFAEAQIRYRYASSLKANGWPQGDTIRKHLLALIPDLKERGFKNRHCFPALPKSLMEGDEASALHNIPKDTLKLWEFSLQHLYSSCNSKGLDTLVWKGKKYPNPKVFGNGMRFYKDWKQCAKGDFSAIYSYSNSKFASSSRFLTTELKWILHGKPEQVSGNEISLISRINNRIQGFL